MTWILWGGRWTKSCGVSWTCQIRPDDETARHAAELRRLRDEGPRADEREEGERRERIQELRRLVDRDLLAGGPMASRREVFEQQFNEALENYRRSRDLGQDSG